MSMTLKLSSLPITVGLVRSRFRLMPDSLRVLIEVSMPIPVPPLILAVLVLAARAVRLLAVRMTVSLPKPAAMLSTPPLP